LSSQGYAASLTIDNALIFRITHIENVPWILENGLAARLGSPTDPDFVAIGNPDLIDRRTHRDVPIPPGGVLSDYVPFYFTPFSMMAFNIKTGHTVKQRRHTDIVILVAGLREVMKVRDDVIFTDSHAYLQTARFFDDVGALDAIDWKTLRTRDFRRDGDDPDRTARYQAEALVFKHLPVNMLKGIACYDVHTRDRVSVMARDAKVDLKVLAKPGMYF